jgi:Fur family ferric uptake transcriptional regulator
MAEDTERLRAAGLRVTAPRLALLAVLAEAGHATAEELATAVRRRLGTISTQAMYDALASFVTAGLARRVEPAGSPARYEARTGDDHHHVVCRSCGAIADVDCAVGRRPCLTPSESYGFAVDETEVTYWGLCPRCAKRPPVRRGAGGAP